LINDFQASVMEIDVEDSCELVDIDVEVDLGHTYTGDLEIVLISPDRRNVTLSRYHGGNENDYNRTVFDDDATISISDPSAEAPFRGRYRPEDPLSIFLGYNARGTWILVVSDNAGGDYGVLRGTTLHLTCRVGGNSNGGSGDDDNTTTNGRYRWTSSYAPRSIDDYRETEMGIDVNDACEIKDVNVEIDVDHTYLADLVVYVIAPNGQNVTLSHRHGETGRHYDHTVFDDEASVFIGDGTPPFDGHFRPEYPLSELDGLNTKGRWRVIVADVASGDVGQFNSAALSFLCVDRRRRHHRKLAAATTGDDDDDDVGWSPDGSAADDVCAPFSATLPDQPYTSYIPNFFYYEFDGTSFRIDDGGEDLFDGGNIISLDVRAGDISSSSSSSSSSVPLDSSSNDTDFTYSRSFNQLAYGSVGAVPEVGVGYVLSKPGTWPFVALASTAFGRVPKWTQLTWTLRGNTGSDGLAWVKNINGALNTTNGRHIKYYANINFNGGDPSIGSVWFTVTSSRWGSSQVRLVYDTRKVRDRDSYTHGVSVRGSNFIFGYTLLSREDGMEITPALLEDFLSHYLHDAPLSWNDDPWSADEDIADPW
jgi:subtilisin-like proprotein convertase family protein